MKKDIKQVKLSIQNGCVDKSDIDLLLNIIHEAEIAMQRISMVSSSKNTNECIAINEIANNFLTKNK